MRCSICGANCRCKNAAGGICCSCHPHKRRAISALVAMPVDGKEHDVPADPHAERWAEIERERSKALPPMRDV